MKPAGTETSHKAVKSVCLRAWEVLMRIQIHKSFAITVFYLTVQCFILLPSVACEERYGDYFFDGSGEVGRDGEKICLPAYRFHNPKNMELETLAATMFGVAKVLMIPAQAYDHSPLQP